MQNEQSLVGISSSRTHSPFMRQEVMGKEDWDLRNRCDNAGIKTRYDETK